MQLGTATRGETEQVIYRAGDQVRKFLRHGDTVEVEIEPIGVLRSPVRVLDQVARATQSRAGS